MISDNDDLHVRFLHHPEPPRTVLDSCCFRDRVLRVLRLLDGVNMYYGEMYFFHAGMFEP